MQQTWQLDILGDRSVFETLAPQIKDTEGVRSLHVAEEEGESFLVAVTHPMTEKEADSVCDVIYGMGAVDAYTEVQGEPQTLLGAEWQPGALVANNQG